MASLSAIDPRAPSSHCSQDPLYNKGTGFEHGERDRLNIRGLLPPRHLDFQTQISRVRLWLNAFLCMYGHGRDEPGALLMMDHTHASWQG